MPEDATNSRARATVKVDAAPEILIMSVYIGFDRAWAAMPPSHRSLGPQGGGSGCTLVRPACAYTEEHDDCVLVTSDKPGHVTPFTAV